MKASFLRAALVVLIAFVVAGCGLTLGGAPALLNPPNEATLACAASGSQYAFVWGAVPNAQTYTLTIDANAAPYPNVVTVPTTSTTASVAATMLTCDATYRWRVCVAFKDNPTPACSGYWTFTIQPAP